MRRTKKRPLKKGKASTETQNSFADALKQPLSRFLFNIDLIEQRVRSEPSNGLVINCVTGKYEFDPELCTARSEDELMASVRRLSSHEPKVGSAMLSSLAPDPDEKDETVLSQWRALNKQFDKQMMCSSSNNKENQKQQRNIVKRKGSIIKKREPFSTWALNDPLSSSSSNSSPTTSSANLSLNIKQLDCSNSSAAASKNASSSAAPLLPSVVRPVYKKRKLWALKFPSSPPSSSSLVPMPSIGPSSSSASAAPVANSSSIGKNNTNKLIRHCLSSSALVSSSSCSSSSKSRHFSKSYKK